VRLVIATILLGACGPRAVLGVRHAAPPSVGAAAVREGEANVAYAVEPNAVSAAHLGDAGAAGGVVISRLPAPHRATPAVAMAPSTPGAARALVGHRDPRAGVQFAIDVAGALTGDPPPAFPEGAALVQWAQEQGRWAPLVAGARPPEGVLASGDLVVFDRAVGGAPATLVAVVLGTDERGVTDLLYLARGVVRRGYLDLGRPRIARDREGRTVNSYVRHGSDHPPPGTRYLAGELASGRVRIR
jgi:hypothetical protein